MRAFSKSSSASSTPESDQSQPGRNVGEQVDVAVELVLASRNTAEDAQVGDAMSGRRRDKLPAVSPHPSAERAGQPIDRALARQHPYVEIETRRRDQPSERGQRRLAMPRLVRTDDALRRPRTLCELSLGEARSTPRVAQQVAASRLDHVAMIADCRYPSRPPSLLAGARSAADPRADAHTAADEARSSRVSRGPLCGLRYR